MKDYYTGRNPSELWTGYLIRRLRHVGVEVGGFSSWGPPDGEGFLATATIKKGSENVIIGLERNILPTPEEINRLSTFRDLERMLEEKVSVALDVPDPDEFTSPYDITFIFARHGSVTVNVEYPEHVRFSFPKYTEGDNYGAEDVIDDLVEFARNPI